ncbi:MAG: CsgG/HfaB family protein, partial [Chitinispirillaceae bacterium]
KSHCLKAGLWNRSQNVGEGMADMLTTALVKEGKYRVMERAKIDKIMEKRALGASGAVTPQTAAKMGKLLGVELAVMGSVTEFGYSCQIMLFKKFISSLYSFLLQTLVCIF